MTAQAGMFTSTTDTWGTPESFLDGLRVEFEFELDPCCLPDTAKAPRYFTPDDDGLAQHWTGCVWMNPPYGRTISKWVAKARTSAEAGATVVCLIPCRTDTDYWHDEVMRHAAEVRLIRQRLHFTGNHEGSAHNAPFPAAVIIFRPGAQGPPTFSSIGRNGRPLAASSSPIGLPW